MAGYTPTDSQSPNAYAQFLAGDQVTAVGGGPMDTPAPGVVRGYGMAPNPYASAAQMPQYQAPNLAQVGQYTAPTTEQAMAAPGVQVGAQLAREGQEASAAAKGSVLSGGFQKALSQYLQDYGTTKYGDVLNQGLSVFNANTGATLGSNQQQLAAANQSFQNQTQAAQGQNQTNQSDYLLNYGTSHQAANDYYNALLDQEHLGAQTGAAQVTA